MERDTTPKDVRRFAVYPHHNQKKVTGTGFVVRSCNSAGVPNDQFNYGGATPEGGRTWSSEAAASLYARQMNLRGGR